MRWGLVPSWAKDSKIAHRTINARSETAAEKPSFRSAFNRRRCLVPASWFYEWQREAGAKVPYRIQRADHRPLAFAGLWERWTGSAAEPPRVSFTVLTTDANDDVAPLHDRMPCLIEPDDFERLPSVEVHGTVVHRGEGSQFVNRTDEPFGVVLDDLDLAGRAVPQTDRA